MFKSFFLNKKWLLWSWGGGLFLILSLLIQVTITVKINEWYKGFYDLLQKPTENDISMFWDKILEFVYLALPYVVLATITAYFTRLYAFRWREAMTFDYIPIWTSGRVKVEGSAQRLQEDTMRFAKIVESLGLQVVRAIMTLIAFTPILWGLSKSITVLPWIGEVEHALVWVAILSALGGTLLLASVGIKLPGIEYDIQKEEAAYRKELVLGEDFKESARPEKITDLYGGVRKIHYKMYFHYLYFNAVKWSYLQGMVIVPYLALAPTIVTGAITLGFVQQIIRAFGRVETSLQYLVRSWPIIVELISVHRRLREFERRLELNKNEKDFIKA